MDTNLKNEAIDNEKNELNDDIAENNLNIPNKDNKKKSLLSTSAGVSIAILIFTLVSVFAYLPIRNLVYKNHGVEKYIESYNFAHTLADITRQVNDNELKNTQSYFDRSYDSMVNIKYHIKDTSTGKLANNMANPDEFRLSKEISNSKFHMYATTDEKGKVSILNLKTTGFSKNAYINTLESFYAVDRSNLGEDRNILEDENKDRLTNLEIHFIVPEKLNPTNDLLQQNMKNMYLSQNLVLILIIGGIGTLILMILAFLTPYSKQKKAGIVTLYNKIYLEFKLIFWFAILMLNIGCIHVIDYNAPSSIFFDLATVVYDANWQFYFIGIPFTFAFYYLIYLSICYIKHIHKSGFMDGLVKNTILGRLFAYIAKTIKDTVITLIEIDDKNKFREKLITLLGINFLALVIISFTFRLGRIFALIYSVVLFKYSIKVLEKIRLLNGSSEELSKGNFDTVLPEDMGILSPFSKNLNMIKEGFKIAVEKEVKSQSMKTELITNVSHDLKTPLTSIITYIDLLKDEKTDEKMRKEYIDVLDRKSKRLKVLIDDLFDVSKASSGNIELYLEELDVIALLRQTLGELEEKIQESKLIFKVNLPENKVLCELDGRKTYRVFDNIISNILKYSMENSRVYIDVEDSDKNISFIFKNIASYEMNFDSSSIIERFTRGDASRSTDGSGLGLAIAKGLTELQKGKLSVSIDGDLFKLIVSFPKITD